MSRHKDVLKGAFTGSLERFLTLCLRAENAEFTTFTMARPAFEDLPLQKGHPQFSAWGLWGKDDELGTLNLLTPDRRKQAALEIQTGDTIPLRFVTLQFNLPTSISLFVYASANTQQSPNRCFCAADEPGAQALHPQNHCKRSRQ